MQILLIDGKNMAWRHGWTRRALHNSKGFPTGVLFGVFAGLIRLHRNFPNAAMVFCWDGAKSNKSWRHKLDSTYKANRRRGGEPPQEVKDVHVQIPILKEMLAVMGLKQFEVDTLEADDIIGVAATALADRDTDVVIYSMDKDFYQLIGRRISVVRDIDKAINCRKTTEADIKEEFGIDIKDWLKYRAFVGDPSDGIKSPIKGVGKVRTKKLLAEGADPSKKECTVESLQGCWPHLRRNYKLLKIVRRIDDKRLDAYSKLKLKNLMIELSFGRKSLYRKAKTKNTYKEMLKYFQKYELEYLTEVREKLWEIP